MQARKDFTSSCASRSRSSGKRVVCSVVSRTSQPEPKICVPAKPVRNSKRALDEGAQVIGAALGLSNKTRSSAGERLAREGGQTPQLLMLRSSTLSEGGQTR